MHANVDPRESDQRREGVERDAEAGHSEREHGGTREADSRVPRREGIGRREVDERLRFGVRERRAVAVGPALQCARDAFRDQDRSSDPRPQPGAIPRKARDPDGEAEPDEPEGAGIREGREERIERAEAVVDDPALERLIEPGQNGYLW